MADDRAWFAPKRLGYGAGLPVAWQGWVMLALHIALLWAGTRLLAQGSAGFLIYMALVALVPLPLYAAKTRGGWRWRNGQKP